MMGFVPAILLFIPRYRRKFLDTIRRVTVQRVDNRLCASCHDRIVCFAYDWRCHWFHYAIYGQKRSTTAIRIGAASYAYNGNRSATTHARRNRNFCGNSYYFGGGIGDFTGGSKQWTYLITTVSFWTLLISLDPIVRGVARTSAEAKAIDASRHGGVPFYDWVFVCADRHFFSLRRRDL